MQADQYILNTGDQICNRDMDEEPDGMTDIVFNGKTCLALAYRYYLSSLSLSKTNTTQTLWGSVVRQVSIIVTYCGTTRVIFKIFSLEVSITRLISVVSECVLDTAH